MKLMGGIALLGLIVWLTFYSAFDIPAPAQCDLLIVQNAEGRWVNIAPDGSATLGRGARRPDTRLKPGSFQFAKAYQILRENAVPARRGAAGPAASIGFMWRHSRSVKTYAVRNEAALEALLRPAEPDRKTTPPTEPTEETEAPALDATGRGFELHLNPTPAAERELTQGEMSENLIDLSKK